jgi:hypothetical protein
MAYLTVAQLRSRVIMPPADFDELDSSFVQSRLDVGSSYIDGRLAKRYATPFTAPVPEVVLGWLTAIVTPELYFRRGWDPASEQGVQITGAADTAKAEIKEAADSVTGLWDLPLRQDNPASGISRGFPLAYSEASPYEWLDVQREAVRER